MKQPPLVSIALCTYNGDKYLAAQLDTLINQTYTPLEIIAVDDCSTDNSFNILSAYAAKYPQFKIYRNKENLGVTANLERAVKLCHGDLIALCDQDDLWHLQKIELQVNAIGDNVFIYHDSEFIYQDGASINKKMSDLMNFYRGDDPLAFLFFNCVSGHSVLMKKSLLNSALPLKQGYFHDWWLAYAATNIGKIDFIPQCLVQYRQHGKSETNILKLAREKDKYKMSSVENFGRTLNWLQYCKSFKGNRNQGLINLIYNAYKKLFDSYMSFEFGILLFKYRKIIFSVRKKTALSKLNYMRKQTWGLKIKMLFSKKHSTIKW